MTLVRFRARNHPQQVATRGPRGEVDDRGTTSEVFDPLHQRFGFTIDVAAAAHNAKLDRYYDRRADGLARSWAGEVVWCNPPYSDLSAWLAKAWAEHRQAHRIVMLVPANRTEQAWWQDHVEPFRDQPGSPLRVEFLRGRLRFLKPGASSVGPNERPPFGCYLLIWSQPGSGAQP